MGKATWDGGRIDLGPRKYQYGCRSCERRSFRLVVYWKPIEGQRWEVEGIGGKGGAGDLREDRVKMSEWRKGEEKQKTKRVLIMGTNRCLRLHDMRWQKHWKAYRN